MTHFETSPLTQFSKFNYFLLVCWFLGKKLHNFVPPAWKLHNPYCHIPRPTHQKKESPPYGLTIYKGYREVVLSRRTVKFILKSNLTKSLLKWSQDITFPEEIFFATLVRINVKRYVHTGIVEQYHTKQAIQYPLCPRRTLWNYATKNCYGQSKRWMCNLRLIETTKLHCKCVLL